MIVLLTDFGQSEYVGVMKGVIYSIACDAIIVDLCHSITPQNIIEASWILKTNYKYFPEGTTFCCVVDPGVGTDRKALGVRTNKYYFVGPDNGLLWEALEKDGVVEMRQILVPKDASQTFHGRDVFAKAAGIIELGDFGAIGEKIKEIEKLELYTEGGEGIVVRIDRFGNIVTNVGGQEKDKYCVEIDGRKYVMEYNPTYYDAKEGELFLIEGSSGTLEISLKNGKASDKLCPKAGTRIKIS